MTTGRKNGRSKLVSVRLPFNLIEDLKKLADELGRPYQAIMKDCIGRGLPIVKELGATEKKIARDSKTYRALNVEASIEKIRAAARR